MKKNLARFVCLLFAIAIALPLAACAGGSSSSSSEEDALKEQIVSTLDQLKACEGEPFQLATQGIQNVGIQSHLDWIGITDEELCRAYLDSFDYEVKSVSITGSTAQARVTLTRRSITTIVKNYLFNEHVGDPELGKQALLDAISATSVEKTDVTLNLTQGDDGQWNAVDALSSVLQSACM